MTRLLSKRWLWGMVLGLAVVGVATVYLQADRSLDQADPQRARREGRPIPVRTALVKQADSEEVVGATALTQGSEIADIQLSPSNLLGANAPASDMIMQTVQVREGDRVRKGQSLFELDDRVLRQIVQQREAAFQAAKAELASIKEDVGTRPALRTLGVEAAEAEVSFRSEALDTRRKEFDALRELEKSSAASLFQLYEITVTYAQARYDFPEAQRHLQRAKIALQVGPLTDQKDLAKANCDLATAALDLEKARRDLERCKLTSPIDGVVGKVGVVAGEALTINSVLTHIIKLDPIHLRLDYPQDRLDDLAVGKEAEVVLDSFPTETFRGKVVRISPQVNAQLRVLPVYVEVSNPEHRIKAGISGYVRLRKSNSALAVPAAAVLQQGGKAMVFRVQEGRARIQEVRAGRLLQSGMLEVQGGLAQNDEVVIFHNFYSHSGDLVGKNGYLQDNDLVDVNWRKWARRE